MMKNISKIIIDTDPGVDDAIAIAFAVKSKLQIEAICTVYGNSTVENSSENALTILELAKSTVPVYQGASKPMQGVGRLAKSHGESGLGGFKVKTEKRIIQLSADEFYRQTLIDASTKKTIVAIGPTTNIGLIARDQPELFNNIEKIIIMGGVFGEKGNVSPYAEFNVYNDPLALRNILSLRHTQVVIVPANICRKVVFTQEIFNKIDNPNLAGGLAEITKSYINYYTKDPVYGKFSGGVMYDLLALALPVDETLFKLEEASVIVETEDTVKYGLTEIVNGEKNCQVVTDVDVEKLTQLYIRTMNS